MKESITARKGSKSNQIKLYFSKLYKYEHVIHDKIYILERKKKHDIRVGNNLALMLIAEERNVFAKTKLIGFKINNKLQFC